MKLHLLLFCSFWCRYLAAVHYNKHWLDIQNQGVPKNHPEVWQIWSVLLLFVVQVARASVYCQEKSLFVALIASRFWAKVLLSDCIERLELSFLGFFCLVSWLPVITNSENWLVLIFRNLFLSLWSLASDLKCSFLMLSKGLSWVL